MATQLSVNVNKVATLRNTRSLDIPSVTRAARLALDAGAHGITVHPRPDERHIRPADVRELAALLEDWPHAEFNIEGNPFQDLVEYAERYRPTQVTLVPDDETQVTSDHGWDLAADGEKLRPVLARLRSLGCRSSLFLDADPALAQRARDVGADRIELYTEPFASAFARSESAGKAEAARFLATAKAAIAAGLEVNAGHDLSLANLPAFLALVPGIVEVSIGHALIAEAIEFGLPETIRKYLAIDGVAPALPR